MSSNDFKKLPSKKGHLTRDATVSLDYKFVQFMLRTKNNDYCDDCRDSITARIRFQYDSIVRSEIFGAITMKGSWIKKVQCESLNSSKNARNQRLNVCALRI